MDAGSFLLDRPTLEIDPRQGFHGVGVSADLLKP
jgi:hypothetical protein